MINATTPKSNANSADNNNTNSFLFFELIRLDLIIYYLNKSILIPRIFTIQFLIVIILPQRSWIKIKNPVLPGVRPYFICIP